MLKDKELRSKKKEIDEIEADWSSAQRDVMRSKLAISDSDADKLAREQTKNKLLNQCEEFLAEVDYSWLFLISGRSGEGE